MQMSVCKLVQKDSACGHEKEMVGVFDQIVARFDCRPRQVFGPRFVAPLKVRVARPCEYASCLSELVGSIWVLKELKAKSLDNPYDGRIGVRIGPKAFNGWQTDKNAVIQDASVLE